MLGATPTANPFSTASRETERGREAEQLAHESERRQLEAAEREEELEGEVRPPTGGIGRCSCVLRQQGKVLDLRG